MGGKCNYNINTWSVFEVALVPLKFLSSCLNTKGVDKITSY